MDRRELARDLGASALTGALLLTLAVTPWAAVVWLGGWTLTRPQGLYVGLLALPVLLLHALKSRRPRRPVGSLLLWRGVVREQDATHPFKRLRRNLPLLLQLFVLAALALGAARPEATRQAPRVDALIVVLDVSASMSAEDAEGGGTRLEAAKAEALALLDDLPRDGLATVLTVGREARTVVDWTQDRGALRAGVEGVRGVHTGTRLDEGLLLAASAAQAAFGAVEVHVFSDGAAPAPPPITLPGPLVVHAVGTSGRNVALTDAQLQPLEEGEGWTLYVSARNAGAASVEAFLSVEQTGAPLAARRLRLPPGRDQSVVMELTLRPGPLELRLRPAGGDVADPLPADDAWYLRVPEDPRVLVARVGSGESPAWQRALEASGAVLQPRYDPAEPALRLVVFEGEVPEVLPPRDCVVVNPAGPVGPIVPGGVLGGGSVVGFDARDPWLEQVSFEDVRVRQARALSLGEGAVGLLTGSIDGAAVVLGASYREGPWRRVVLGFDPYEADWPLRASFPIFVYNAVHWAARWDALARGGLQVGEPLVIPWPGVDGPVTLEGPVGPPVTLEAQGGRVELSGVERAGVYTVHDDAHARVFCANLRAPDEVEILPNAEWGATVDALDAHAQLERPVVVSWYAALLALLALLVEGWAYHRRW